MDSSSSCSRSACDVPTKVSGGNWPPHTIDNANARGAGVPTRLSSEWRIPLDTSSRSMVDTFLWSSVRSAAYMPRGPCGSYHHILLSHATAGTVVPSVRALRLLLTPASEKAGNKKASSAREVNMKERTCLQEAAAYLV